MSGPTRAPARPARRSGLAPPRPARRENPLARLARLALRLAQGRTLDRLLRGRAAIALVAFALIGIVTLQLALLELNAGVGRTLQRQATLQRTNAQLSIENSELASGERVQSRATAAGMTPAPARALRFLSSGGQADAARGAAALKPPAPEAHATWGEASEGGSGGEASAAGTSEKGEASEAHSAAGEAQPSGEASAASTAKSGGEEAGREATTGGERTSPRGEGPAGGSSSGGEASAASAAQSGGAAAAPGG